MKLLTLNTHSLIEPDYEAKREAFVDFIAEEQPDVFALQEVNQTGLRSAAGGCPGGILPLPRQYVLLKADNHAAAVARMLEERGVQYHWSWLPAKIGYDRYDEGMAVFSRAPITAAENLLLSKSSDYKYWKTRRALGILCRRCLVLCGASGLVEGRRRTLRGPVGKAVAGGGCKEDCLSAGRFQQRSRCAGGGLRPHPPQRLAGYLQYGTAAGRGLHRRAGH